MFVKFLCLVLMIKDTYWIMVLIVWLIFIKCKNSIESIESIESIKSLDLIQNCAHKAVCLFISIIIEKPKTLFSLSLKHIKTKYIKFK